MRIGATSVNVISDGTILVDGGVVFGPVPRTDWEVYLKPDRKNRVRLGLNCLLIKTPTQTILVDTGAGAKQADAMKDSHGLVGNKLVKGLKKVGLTPRDIDVVLLSHLQYHVAGGCTKLDRSGVAVPMFPRAKYLVQRAAWEEAINPNERNRKLYSGEDFRPLEEHGMLELLDGDTEITPGVRVQRTDGYSNGHQITLVEAGSERIAFLGDLIPTPFHIALSTISAFDRDPHRVLEEKRKMVGLAVGNGWLMVFGHAGEQVGAYVEERNGRSQLLPVEI